MFLPSQITSRFGKKKILANYKAFYNTNEILSDIFFLSYPQLFITFSSFNSLIYLSNIINEG